MPTLQGSSDLTGLLMHLQMQQQRANERSEAIRRECFIVSPQRHAPTAWGFHTLTQSPSVTTGASFTSNKSFAMVPQFPARMAPPSAPGYTSFSPLRASCRAFRLKPTSAALAWYNQGFADDAPPTLAETMAHLASEFGTQYNGAALFAQAPAFLSCWAHDSDDYLRRLTPALVENRRTSVARQNNSAARTTCFEIRRLSSTTTRESTVTTRALEYGRQ